MRLQQLFRSRLSRAISALGGAFILTLTVMLCASTALAHPTSTCYWGGSPHFYSYAYSFDIAKSLSEKGLVW